MADTEPEGTGVNPDAFKQSDLQQHQPLFETFQEWRDALDAWRYRSRAPNVGDHQSEVCLVLSSPPTPTEPPRTASLRIDSEPDPGQLRDAIANPEFPAFVGAAQRLAQAATSLIPALQRFGKPLDQAVRIAETFGKEGHLPNRDDDKATWSLQRQVEDIDTQIWNGALPREEDQRYRRSYWGEQLRRIRTRQGRTSLGAAVERILGHERTTDELALLNTFQTVRQYEEERVIFEPIIAADGTDPLTTCRRWLDLVSFGHRYSRATQSGDGEAVNFRDLVDTRRDYPDDSGPCTEVEWAEHLRTTTESLRRFAIDADFKAGERLPINELARDLERVLDGEAVDIRPSTERVRPLVNEITNHYSERREAVLDRFHQVARNLRHGLACLLELVSGYQLHGHGLLILDQYVLNLKHRLGGGPGRPCDESTWRATITSLQDNLVEAEHLWTWRAHDAATCLRDDFRRIGTSKAKLSLLHDSTFHELLITLTRVILDPYLPGAVPPYALDSFDTGVRTGRHGAVRLRLVAALLAEPWTREQTLEFEGERATVLADLVATERKRAPDAPKAPKREPLDVLFALQDLVVDASRKDERAGADAQELLFGDGNLHADLAAIAAQKDAYARRFGGSPQAAIKWAPRNGHHALAWWCESIANLTKVRSTTIPRLRTELADAKIRGDRAAVVLLEGRVRDAEIHFATSIADALAPLLKDYDWIRESLQSELTRPPAPLLPASVPAPPTLGNGGPSKTFDAVCAAILDAKKAAALELGDQVEQTAVIKRIPKESVPMLRIGQLPARVLVTLLLNSGGMTKRDLHTRHREGKPDDPALANLLTPSGTLSADGLIVSTLRTVALTPKGHAEARLQRAAKTQPLGSPLTENS